MLKGARLTLEAPVYDDDSLNPTTGVFDLSDNLRIGPGIRTGDLIGPTGSQIGALIDAATGGDEGRAGFRLDAGGGALTVEVDFRSFTGADGQWGDNSGNPQADATGEDLFRQISVFIRYLNQGVFDSRGQATLEFLEWSDSGVYDPKTVALEDPQTVYDSEEESSMYDGSVTFVATRSVTQAAYSQQQDQG